MPNWCAFEMKVIGNTDAINELVSILTYQHPSCQFYRVASASVYEAEEDYACICGDAAWSVRSSMMNHSGKYDCSKKEFMLISTVSERLQLEIEIFSDEPGVGFQEHYLFRNGEIIINDCVDTMSVYFDEDAYEGTTREERFASFLREEPELGVSLDDFDENGYYQSGGIENWGVWTI